MLSVGIPAKRKQQATKKILKKIKKLDKCGLKKGMGHGVHGFKKHHHLHHKHHGHGNTFKHGSGLNNAFRPKCGHSPKNGQNINQRHISRQGITHGPRIAHGSRMGRGLRHGVHHGHRGHRVGPRFNNGRNRHGSGPSPSHREVGSADILIVDDSDIEIVFEDVGVDVTFDVRTKPSQDQQAQTSAASPPPTVPSPTVTPPAIPSPTVPFSYFTTPSSSVPLATTPQATPVPATTPVAKPDVPSTSSQTETIPAATIETQTEPARERRNSDDWTILNRESPVRNEMIAMDVDESQGAKAKTPPPPAAQDTPAPSAPPNTDDLTDAERRRIEEAIATFRSMGFDHNTQNLREMLRIQNCDMISVLEMMLNAKKK